MSGRDSNMWGTLVVALALLSVPGCVNPVFNSPATISTSSKVAQNATLLEPVRAEATSFFFILLPIIPDPRDLFDDLLAEAAKVGGNSVVDVQVRSDRFFAWAFPPIIVDTVEAEGMAAIVK